MVPTPSSVQEVTVRVVGANWAKPDPASTQPRSRSAKMICRHDDACAAILAIGPAVGETFAYQLSGAHHTSEAEELSAQHISGDQFGVGDCRNGCRDHHAASPFPAVLPLVDHLARRAFVYPVRRRAQPPVSVATDGARPAE